VRPSYAAQNLEVDLEGLTEDKVRTAFAKKIRATHPDTAGSETAIAAAMIVVFQKSRDVLLAYVKDENELQWCEICDGTGKQKTRSGGLIKCMRCAGQGRYRRKEFHRG
jgi:hypothetical protein